MLDVLDINFIVAVLIIMELKDDAYYHGNGRGSCSPQESMLDFMTVVISIVQVLFIIV